VTGSYKVVVKKSAEKELRSIPSRDLMKLIDRIKNLSIQPRPQGCEKMAGEDRYRIRQGDWRFIYTVEDPSKTVTVYKIGHRREVYR
jgi:mRNA interferase RelE/StbE